MFYIFKPTLSTNNKFYVCNAAFFNVFLIFTFHNHHNEAQMFTTLFPCSILISFLISPLVPRNLAHDPIRKWSSSLARECLDWSGQRASQAFCRSSAWRRAKLHALVILWHKVMTHGRHDPTRIPHPHHADALTHQAWIHLLPLSWQQTGLSWGRLHMEPGSSYIHGCHDRHPWRSGLAHAWRLGVRSQPRHSTLDHWASHHCHPLLSDGETLRGMTSLKPTKAYEDSCGHSRLFPWTFTTQATGLGQTAHAENRKTFLSVHCWKHVHDFGITATDWTARRLGCSAYALGVSHLHIGI